ncbi:hypothetical protein D9C73_008102 [Collichthys lucidus]|uniref:Uncharacterized protein n=1 Tax=Collichthys lucidus TaxID=240159 RepID=A0A4U5UIL4_COLLU|nr:hypothetical protein D9C73_008102 [Collichthys lucidus]
MEPISQNLRDQISELLKPHRVCLVMPVVLNHSSQSCGRSAKRKGRWEESNPAQATPPETSSTPPILFSFSSDNITSSTTTTVTSPSVPSTDTSFASTDVLPLSTSSTPPTAPFVTTSNTTTTTTTTALPTKNIKKKFGDFFAFKRARTGRASKAGGGEGGGEGVKVKRTSIADLIRPLREAKERERERERDKEREKGERGKVSGGC